jgi:ATP-binding cassette subfamily B protein
MAALAGAERAFELLDEKEESPDVPGAAAISSALGRARFEGVGFSYDAGRPVLSGIDIDAKAGSLTAIVGPTGAGKTTIVNLLARFYDPDSGAVSLDGLDARLYRRADYMARFGVVLQDAYLFPGTVRDNIRYARPDADDGAVRAACAVAGAMPFIDRLPGGLDATIGIGDSGMSHGQLQLIAIARAALAEPDVLILDEATGSLDTRTELHVQRGLRALMAGRTTFVIAHRLRTVMEADRILVVDGGRIVESGDHDSLLAAGGLYARMHEAQRGGTESP